MRYTKSGICSIASMTTWTPSFMASPLATRAAPRACRSRNVFFSASDSGRRNARRPKLSTKAAALTLHAPEAGQPRTRE
jgi:hypothetical protein